MMDFKVDYKLEGEWLRTFDADDIILLATSDRRVVSHPVRYRIQRRSRHDTRVCDMLT